MLPGFAGIAGITSPKLLTYQELKTDTTNGSSFTLSAASIGAASDGRVVIVGISYGSDTGQTINSVTIGGVSASIRVQDGIDGGLYAGAGIAAAVVPTGTTADIDITFSASVAGVGVGVWTATGLSGTTAVDTGSNTDLTALAITTDAGGFAIAVVTNVDSRSMSWTNITEDYDGAFDGVLYASGASIATSTTSLTITPTPSGAVTAAVLVAASF